MPKKKKKKTDKQTIILTIVFIVLLLLVIGLIIDFIIVKHKVDNTPKVDITIPILDKSKDASVTINISNKKKDDVIDYSFKIKNYLEKTNNKKIEYDIIFSSTNNVEFNLKNNNKNIDINNNKVEGLVLKSKKKEDIIYNLKIKLLEDTDKDSKVVVSIDGK